MQFLNDLESRERFFQCGYIGAASSEFVRIEDHCNGVRVSYDGKANLLDLARRVVGWMGSAEWLLLTITENGIWPSWENLRLYERLKQSYGGGNRTLSEERGHYFARDEYEDAITFLQLAMSFGWGGYLIGKNAVGTTIFSHDEWIAFETSESFDKLKEMTKAIAIPVSIYRV